MYKNCIKITPSPSNGDSRVILANKTDAWRLHQTHFELVVKFRGHFTKKLMSSIMAYYTFFWLNFSWAIQIWGKKYKITTNSVKKPDFSFFPIRLYRANMVKIGQNRQNFTVKKNVSFLFEEIWPWFLNLTLRMILSRTSSKIKVISLQTKNLRFFLRSIGLFVTLFQIFAILPKKLWNFHFFPFFSTNKTSLRPK